MSKLKLEDNIKSRIQSSIPTVAHNELIEDAGGSVKKFRARRAKFEDNYTRMTFYIENNMLEWLNNATAGEKV